jgi:hypothetical protein
MEFVTRQPGASSNKEEAKHRHGRFQRLGLPAKFKLLETQFEIKTELRGHVESINAVRNCLVHRLGVVRADDVDDDGVLVLKLRRYRLHVVDPKTETSTPAVFGVRYGDMKAQSVFDDSLRTFSIGEHIHFNPEELFDCTHTMAAFDQSMAVSFAQLATRFGIPFGPAKASGP